MTAPAATGSARAGGGRTVLWVVLVVGALLAVGWLGLRNDSVVPYDPDSVEPTGTRAFVELLESFDVDVDVPATTSIDDIDPSATMVVFQAWTTPEQDERLRRWVRDGGTLVVADPYSTLVPVVDFATDGVLDVIEQGTCTVAAFDDVAALDPTVDRERFQSPPVSYPVGDGDRSCFGSDELAFAVVTPSGAGAIVALGTGSVFMNGALGKEDNAALAVSLFAPRPGGQVVIVEPGSFGAATSGEIGSIDRIVGAALPFLLLQALIGVVLLALAQGRRLGKPVAEPQPVQIAGSELVQAMGDLLQQSGSPDRAAAILRADLRRELCLRIGLPATTPVDVIAATVDARTGLGRERVLAVIADVPVERERDLVELACSIDSIREEILHVPSA